MGDKRALEQLRGSVGGWDSWDGLWHGVSSSYCGGTDDGQAISPSFTRLISGPAQEDTRRSSGLPLPSLHGYPHDALQYIFDCCCGRL